MRSKLHFHTGTVLKYAVLTVLGIALFDFCADLAYQHRGYYAVGGEVFTLLLPLWYYLLSDMIRGIIDEWRDTREED